MKGLYIPSLSLIFLAFSMSSPPEGLIGYWKFDEGKGNIAMDSSPNGIRAIIKGAEWTKGMSGSAIQFRGKDSVIIDSEKLDGMDELTLSCWILLQGDGRYSPIAKKDCVYRFIFLPEGDHFVIATENNPWYSSGAILPFKGVSRGKWCHISATYKSGDLRVYVDGELVAQTGKVTGRVKHSSSNPLVLGLSDGPNLDNFIGKIDELMVFQRALTSDEIKKIYDTQIISKYIGELSEKKIRLSTFKFSRSFYGWKGIEVEKMEIKDNKLVVQTTGGESAIVNNALNVPLKDKDFLFIKMSTTGGKEGKVFLLTSKGAKTIKFPLSSDGQVHTYCLNLPKEGEEEQLLALVVFPSDEKCTAEILSLELLNKLLTPPQIKIDYFFSDLGVNRAKRPVKILAYLTNKGGKGMVRASLVPCEGVKVLDGENRELFMDYGDRGKLKWRVEAEKALEGILKLSVWVENGEETFSTYKITFTPPVEIRKADYIPEPQPVDTDVLIGALNCPLWESTDLWKTVLRDLWRVPVLGFYDELNPEVKDWEIKWAVEHGIQFFVFCWYRVNQGKAPIQTIFERPITEALFKAKFLPYMKFAIMWENQNKGIAGVSDENDLLNNLLPYWIETFFKHPSYLKIDNKPLLFIYRPEFLVDDLGSVENVRKALNKMRDKCKDAGFNGLIILGEYRGLDPNHLKLMQDLGLDYTFAYVWPIPNNPPPDVAIKTQVDYWEKTRDMGLIPEVITLSMGWTGWQDEGSIWKLPPKDFQTLCEKAKEFIRTLPKDQLGSRMILIDNWNEWGEGHYIMPYREYGFGYLDAIRNVFGKAPREHIDLIPEDLCLGPYDHPGFER
ncbi:glycoside hydrolase family 99-like domain-containing protein [bacterium]|nr:glycoside hydrolase family 99-like domain-containing protein [bacterium]